MNIEKLAKENCIATGKTKLFEEGNVTTVHCLAL